MAGGRRHVPLAAGVEDMAVVREHFTRALECMHKAPNQGSQSVAPVYSRNQGASCTLWGSPTFSNAWRWFALFLR